MTFLSPEGQPKYVQWYVTGRCNSQCVHCNVLGTPLVENRTQLSVEACFDVIGNLDIPVSALEFIGGEPLCHPSLTSVVRFASESGVNCILATNGLALDFSGEQADLLHLLGSVSISVDGIDRETYKSIRGVDGFDHVVRCVTHCISAMGPERVRVVYVLTKQTMQPPQKILDFFTGLGVRHLAINTLRGKGVNNAPCSCPRP